MYLSELERKEIMAAYDCGDFIEQNHYQVEPDTWIYLYRDVNNRKYILIAADYSDYNYDVFPHLLKFNNSEFKNFEFVLQREIPIKNDSLKEEMIGCTLFEYTD